MNFAPSRPNKTNIDDQDDDGLLGVSWNETLRDIQSGIESLRLLVFAQRRPEEEWKKVYDESVRLGEENNTTIIVEGIQWENGAGEEIEERNITVDGREGETVAVEDTEAYWIIDKEAAKLTVVLMAIAIRLAFRVITGGSKL